MTTNRESEIREESLSLAVAAYNMVGNMDQVSTHHVRSQIVDNCFHVSSLIAKAFSTVQNEDSEQFVARGLEQLNKIIKTTLEISITSDEGKSIELFLHIAEELKLELIDLLSAIKLKNSESFSPKLEPTCI